MTSRPSNLVSAVSRIVAPTFIARRPRTSKQRNSAPWRVGRWKKRYVPAPATLDGAIVAALLPTVSRVQDSNGRWRATHAGRLITFGVPVAIMHLAVLRWIFLPIGG